jgi:hypothetical protein
MSFDARLQHAKRFAVGWSIGTCIRTACRRKNVNKLEFRVAQADLLYHPRVDKEFCIGNGIRNGYHRLTEEVHGSPSMHYTSGLVQRFGNITQTTC